MAENRGLQPNRHCRIAHGTAICAKKNDVQTIAYGLSLKANSAIASLSCLTRSYRHSPPFVPTTAATRPSSTALRPCKKGLQRRLADAAGSPRNEALHAIRDALRLPFHTLQAAPLRPPIRPRSAFARQPDRKHVVEGIGVS